jgi:hypothetical protein
MLNLLPQMNFEKNSSSSQISVPDNFFVLGVKNVGEYKNTENEKQYLIYDE